MLRTSKDNENNKKNFPVDEINAKDKNKLKAGQKGGLYAALGVCLVSVAAAALVTYMGFSDIGGDTEVYTVGTGAVESAVSEYENDDPLTDGRRSDTTAEKDESYSENSVASHEGEEAESVNVNAKETEETNTDNIKEELTENDTATDAEPETEETAAAPVTYYEVSAALSYPVENPEVIREYSSDLAYNETMKDYRSHNGTDFIASLGQEVYAVANGKVAAVYSDVLLGNVIEIEHGEYTVRYCGLGATALVRPGDVVSAGTAIGSVKEVPFESGDEPHLHLEVLRDGAYLDPASLIK